MSKVSVLGVRDERRARQLAERLEERRRRGLPHAREAETLDAHLAAAAQRTLERAARIPAVTYPEELPVAQRREEIIAALRAHPVVVVCGETGSGKTTQLPKLCMEAGSGRRGLIGHTQPRRIAARTVAARIAEELQVPLGEGVGFKVRFTDRTSPATLVKLMTDGILLAELREDPDLTAYDTLIIDEAHERSLNIDFLLGVLHGLRERRPDLRIVITSATIETARFAAFFAAADGTPAPVIEVSGRAWPVETRYRPLASDADDDLDPGVTAGVLRAVEEIRGEPGEVGRGDILVFLPGEREIRDTAEALEAAVGGRVDVLPLYSRLSWADQQKVFQRGGRQRVVLATNVAETSLTVPGIRSVIDVGLARISRYSPRVKIQRLPVEPVSQASANQRQGRCGRVGPGLCIRLYSEDDFNSRAAFTPPEVLRTNLASVILQMETLGLGAPQDFPFIDPPETRLVSDGYRLLQELEAVDDDREVTPLGRQLARLPVDPRIARMLFEARKRGALREVLVLAAALSMQDPRERPQDAQAQADQKHAVFAQPDSDFATLLKVWEAYQAERAARSRSALRRWCRDWFLSAVRMREWEELHAQLSTIAQELDWKPAERAADYEALHRSLLSGLLGNIGLKADPPGRGAPGTEGKPRERVERGLYEGARGMRFVIAPGSPLRNKAPRWLMAGTLVETQRVYARLVAGIDPAWIEQAAQHLVKRSHGDPAWDEQRGQASISETVTLYGLTLATGRRVNYAQVDPAAARELFVREALVHGRSRLAQPFLAANRATCAQLAEEEAKLRRQVVVKDEVEQAALYLERVPADVHSVVTFNTWWKQADEAARNALTFSAQELRQPGAPVVNAANFPAHLRAAGNALPVAYCFDPERADDGATLTVPQPLVMRLVAAELVGAIPGWRVELVTEWIRALPKQVRRQLVPAPDVAARCVQDAAAREAAGAPFVEAIAALLTTRAGEPITAAMLERLEVPEHLHLFLRVVDASGRVVAQGRELEELRRQARREAGAPAPVVDQAWQRTGVKAWDFNAIPPQLTVERQGVRLALFPAIADRGESVDLTLEDDASGAARVSRQGVVRLAALAIGALHRGLEKDLAADRDLMLLHQPVGPSKDFARQLADRVVARALWGAGGEGELPATRTAFEAAVVRARPELHGVRERLQLKMRELLTAASATRRELAALPEGLDAVLVEDVRASLARLVFPGFVAATPDPWLDLLVKYVKTVGRRAAKLRGMQGRVAEAQYEQRDLWQRYTALQAAAKAAGHPAHALDTLHWTLEEYALSVFAQDLKATLTVSPKRVQAAFEETRLALRLPNVPAPAAVVRSRPR